MKHLFVGLITVSVFALMGYLYSSGKVYHGGVLGEVTQDISSIEKSKEIAKVEKKTEEDKLQALKEKAGSINSFSVSLLYKTRCSSCHGGNGQGIIGPHLSGLQRDDIYKKLLDYKAGRVENQVMRGVLINLKKEQLASLADEIATFKTKETH